MNLNFLQKYYIYQFGCCYIILFFEVELLTIRELGENFQGRDTRDIRRKSVTIYLFIFLMTDTLQ